MNSKEKLFQQHIEELQLRTRKACELAGVQGVIIHAGKPHRIFGDDMDYPFKVSPHFKQWLPITKTPNCYLQVNGHDKPTLIFYQPVDFWHKVADVPNEFWIDSFNVKVITEPSQALTLFGSHLNDWAYIGEHENLAREAGFKHTNPQEYIDYCHYHRSFKTLWEQNCMEQANQTAALGHVAAKNAFYAGASEFAINQAFIKATSQGENEAPYGAIVALNQNASILHYTQLETRAPEQLNSFLIDAGASCNGYASDITRTYAFSSGLFADMIEQMDQHLIAIIAQIKPGVPYVDLHQHMHGLIADMLLQFGIANGDSESLIEQGITKAFFPHGLGHMLGLQVHDVAGFMQTESGEHLNAPAQHPFLRCTRALAESQVLTVEPGLYIIDTLLNNLSADAKLKVNWNVVDVLRPFGGIRIEDNVLVTREGSINFTRNQGL
ncbi:Xaa-Pro dipeptidase [Paraferrimonas haliotis]|uniref:Xaa-Pro dipeptidase n=1 Tax=Paraferrimonas haliotis TaxID=2013866 RepID=A0AA37TNR4_9GAMM|nr:Xaa-Pro dipeptidase [Paraferrimonas haliotis]GLS84817.1 Xaa-Pro dipeptidase [Paraferrimonas haliotis]